jgi:hypothetical protein
MACSTGSWRIAISMLGRAGCSRPSTTRPKNGPLPRHRYILMSYARHRHLEFSGNYEDVLTDHMMADHPNYTIRALGMDIRINGKDEVRALYKNWAETNQCVFFLEDEQVAVGDNFVASRLTVYQQIWGGTFTAAKVLRILPK